jgi:hypothetical protein
MLALLYSGGLSFKHPLWRDLDSIQSGIVNAVAPPPSNMDSRVDREPGPTCFISDHIIPSNS